MTVCFQDLAKIQLQLANCGRPHYPSSLDSHRAFSIFASCQHGHTITIEHQKCAHTRQMPLIDAPTSLPIIGVPGQCGSVTQAMRCPAGASKECHECRTALHLKLRPKAFRPCSRGCGLPEASP